MYDITVYTSIFDIFVTVYTIYFVCHPNTGSRQPNVEFFAKRHRTFGCIGVPCMSMATGNFVNDYTYVATDIG